MEETMDYGNNFDPEWYLSTYYGEDLGSVTKFVLNCFHEAFSIGEVKGKQLLDVGTGPSIISVISASIHVEDIYLSDYTAGNLDILRSWWHGDRTYLKNIFEYVESLEKTGQSAEERNDLIRSKVRAIMPIDITSSVPLQSVKADISCQFDIVTSCLCLEACSLTMDQYSTNLKNAWSLVKDGGLLILFGSLDGDWYRVGSYKFKQARLTKEEMFTLFKENNFKILLWKQLSSSGLELPKDQIQYSNCTDGFIVVAQKSE